MELKHYLTCLLIPLLPLHGQDDSNRFKKKPHLPGNNENLPFNYITHYEYISVSEKTINQWDAQNPGKHPSRKQVKAWEEQKQAKVDESFVMVNRPGVPFTQTSGLELIHPTEFKEAPSKNSWPIPATFKTKQLGHSLRTISAPEGENSAKCQIHLSFAQFLESDSYLANIEQTREKEDILIPKFHIYDFNPSISQTLNHWNYIGRFQLGPNSQKSHLVYSRIDKSPLPPIKFAGAPREDSQDDSDSLDPFAEEANKNAVDNNLKVQVFAITLEHSAWLKFSKSHSLSSLNTQAGPWVSTLMTEHQITWDSSTVLNMDTGRGHVRLGQEHLYPKTYIAPEDRAKVLELRPAEFNKRNVGITLEVEAHKPRKSYIDLRFNWDLVSFHGENVIHRVLKDDKWVPDAWMPRFSISRQNTALILYPGQLTLVSVMPALDKEGLPDTSKRFLLFIKAE